MAVVMVGTLGFAPSTDCKLLDAHADHSKAPRVPPRIMKQSSEATEVGLRQRRAYTTRGVLLRRCARGAHFGDIWRPSRE